MQITKVTVHAGRTLPHPCESYANLRPALTLEATLSDSDDPVQVRKQLQVMAERAVEEHATALVASLEQRQVIEREDEEISRLERGLVDSQSRLSDLKERAATRENSDQALLPF